MEQKDAAALATALVIALVILIAADWARDLWKGRSKFTLNQTRPIASSLDDFQYRVHPGHDGAEQAADIMDKLNLRSVELMRHLREKYVRDPRGTEWPERKEATRRLLAHYNPDNLVENSPRDPDGDTSYTINKGEVLAFCLRAKDSHGFHDMETLTFVALHELTHIAITDQDHPPRFWRAFKFVLEDAREAGVIRGQDYGRSPTRYCGMDIDYSPLFDEKLEPFV